MHRELPWVFAEQGSGCLGLTCFLSGDTAVWLLREDSFEWSTLSSCSEDPPLLLEE